MLSNTENTDYTVDDSDKEKIKITKDNGELSGIYFHNLTTAQKNELLYRFFITEKILDDEGYVK